MLLSACVHSLPQIIDLDVIEPGLGLEARSMRRYTADIADGGIIPCYFLTKGPGGSPRDRRRTIHTPYAVLELEERWASGRAAKPDLFHDTCGSKSHMCRER